MTGTERRSLNPVYYRGDGSLSWGDGARFSTAAPGLGARLLVEILHEMVSDSLHNFSDFGGLFIYSPVYPKTSSVLPGTTTTKN